LYAEGIFRFDDGDIKEYRKFSDWCPSYLYTERYNEFKRKTNYELQLPDKRFYSVSYNQPSGTIHQETYCSENGTLCDETTYIYNKKGEFVSKNVSQTQPCIETQLDGKKRSTKSGVNLEGQ
jgi:predicted choloylglycine hydrolase